MSGPANFDAVFASQQRSRRRWRRVRRFVIYPLLTLIILAAVLAVLTCTGPVATAWREREAARAELIAHHPEVADYFALFGDIPEAENGWRFLVAAEDEHMRLEREDAEIAALSRGSYFKDVCVKGEPFDVTAAESFLRKSQSIADLLAKAAQCRISQADRPTARGLQLAYDVSGIGTYGGSISWGRVRALALLKRWDEAASEAMNVITCASRAVGRRTTWSAMVYHTVTKVVLDIIAKETTGWPPESLRRVLVCKRHAESIRAAWIGETAHGVELWRFAGASPSLLQWSEWTGGAVPPHDELRKVAKIRGESFADLLKEDANHARAMDAILDLHPEFWGESGQVFIEAEVAAAGNAALVIGGTMMVTSAAEGAIRVEMGWVCVQIRLREAETGDLKGCVDYANELLKVWPAATALWTGDALVIDCDPGSKLMHTSAGYWAAKRNQFAALRPAKRE